MIYAILGTAIGGLGAVVSLLFGAPVLLALGVYVGAGMTTVFCGILLAALCLWRHPGQDDRMVCEELG